MLIGNFGSSPARRAVAEFNNAGNTEGAKAFLPAAAIETVNASTR